MGPHSKNIEIFPCDCFGHLLTICIRYYNVVLFVFFRAYLVRTIWNQAW